VWLSTKRRENNAKETNLCNTLRFRKKHYSQRKINSLRYGTHLVVFHTLFTHAKKGNHVLHLDWKNKVINKCQRERTKTLFTLKTANRYFYTQTKNEGQTAAKAMWRQCRKGAKTLIHVLRSGKQLAGSLSRTVRTYHLIHDDWKELLMNTKKMVNTTLQP